MIKKTKKRKIKMMMFWVE